MKLREVSDANVAERVAVICALEREKLCLSRFGFRRLPPILERHFQGDFDGGGAVVGIKNVVESGRS